MAIALESQPTPDAKPADAKPVVISFEEGVRRQLRKKANLHLVDQKPEVLRLLNDLKSRTFAPPELVRVCLHLTMAAGSKVEGSAMAAATAAAVDVTDDAGADGGSSSVTTHVDTRLTLRLVDTSAPVVAWFTQLSGALESVGLPLECEKEETWGDRLLIAKKGGGHHFSEGERELADAAYARVGALYDYVTASEQLAEVAERLPRLVETLGVQKQLSKLQRVEKCGAAISQALELLERLGGGSDRQPCERMRRRFTQARLPDSLPTSLTIARRALPKLLGEVLTLCELEYAQWCREATAKRRFRTPHAHALLHAACGVVDTLQGHAACKEDLLSTLLPAIRELRTREVDLHEAADAANAALARDEYDEAV